MLQSIRTALITLAGLAIFFLFINFPAPPERLLNIQDYLITVSGIISAFVIAYLSAKIFNIRSEREVRQNEINKLADKLTAYRKLLYFVMKSDGFWAKYEDIAKFKRKYPGLNYERLRSPDEGDTLKSDFWLKETEISQNTISLYCAMEAIYGDPDARSAKIPWAYDRAISFKYSIDDIVKYYEPSNQIWYHLEGRFGKHGRGLFNDSGISMLFEENVRELLSQIDIKYKGLEFHRRILAEIGTEFYEYILPKMAELISLNVGIPKSLMNSFSSLLIILFSGVVLPIIIQCISISDRLNTFFTLFFVGTTILSIINFVINFYELLNDEVHLNNK